MITPKRLLDLIILMFSLVLFTSSAFAQDWEDPQLFYKIDDGSGTNVVNNVTTDFYNGTIAGGFIWNSSSWFSERVGNYHLECNSPTNSSVKLDTGFYGMSGSGATGTVSIWMSVNDNSDWWGVLGNGPVGVANYSFAVQVVSGSPALRLKIDAGASSHDTPITVGATFLYTIVRDGADYRIYINGTNEFNMTGDSSLNGSLILFQRCQDPPSCYSYCDGVKMDEVSAYDTALTHEEIIAKYNSEKDLIFHYDISLDERALYDNLLAVYEFNDARFGYPQINDTVINSYDKSSPAYLRIHDLGGANQPFDWYNDSYIGGAGYLQCDAAYTGTHQRVDTGISATGNINLTVQGFFTIGTDSDYISLFGNGDATNNYDFLVAWRNYNTTHGFLDVYGYDSGQIHRIIDGTNESGEFLEINQKYHIAMVKSNEDYKVYVDGVLKDSFNLPNSNPGSVLLIAQYSSDASWGLCEGTRYDEWIVHGRVLSADEIDFIYNNFYPWDYATLMDEDFSAEPPGYTEVDSANQLAVASGQFQIRIQRTSNSYAYWNLSKNITQDFVLKWKLNCVDGSNAGDLVGLAGGSTTPGPTHEEASTWLKNDDDLSGFDQLLGMWSDDCRWQITYGKNGTNQSRGDAPAGISLYMKDVATYKWIEFRRDGDIVTSRLCENVECTNISQEWAVGLDALPTNLYWFYYGSDKYSTGTNQINPNFDDMVITSPYGSYYEEAIGNVPLINSHGIVPTYPDSENPINCTFNVTDTTGDDVNVSVTWYTNSSGSWANNNTYDYTFANVTHNLFYSTGVGTGSVAFADNYSSWFCNIEVISSLNNFSNSSIVSVYPLENLTVITPANNTLSNETLNVSFSVIDYDEGISCTLEVESFDFTQNLIHRWPFNESTGSTAYDYIGSDNFALHVGYYDWTTGVEDYAATGYYQNAYEGAIRASGVTDFDDAGSNFTLSYWFKYNGTEYYHSIFDTTNNVNDVKGFHTAYLDNGTFVMTYGDGGGWTSVTCDNTFGVAAEFTWLYGVIVKNETGITMYINGAYPCYIDSTGMAAGVGGIMFISGGGSNDQIDVDEVHMWDYDMTATQVAELYMTEGIYPFIASNIESVNSGEVSYLGINLPTDGFYNWNLSCTAQEDTVYTDNYVYRYDSVPPVVNQLYISPTYPADTDDLNCNFQVTEAFPFDVNVTWIKNITGSWENDTTYDYSYTGATSGLLYTTTVGTGSVPAADVTNYSYWKCSVTVSDYYIVTETTNATGIHPLENLTIYSPANNTLGNESLNVSFTVIDLDEGINCTLTVPGAIGLYDTATAYAIMNTSKVWYKMDETSGTLVEDELGNYDATAVATQTMGIPGRDGTGFNFSNTGGPAVSVDYFVTDDPVSTILGADPDGFSITLWMKGTDVNDGDGYTDQILTNYNSNSKIEFGYAETDRFVMGLGQSPVLWAVYNVTPSYDVDGWNLFVFTFNETSNNASLYINGELSATHTYTGSNFIGSGTAFTFAAKHDDKRYGMKSEADELAVYDYELSQAQAIALYDAYNVPPTVTSSVNSGEVSYLGMPLTSDGYYDWNLSCTSNSGTLYSDNYVYRYDSAPPVIDQLYITPTYPHTYDDLDCNFEVTEAFDFDVNVTWFKNVTGSWENDATYDYIYTDATSEFLYTTDIGNGSVPASALNNYTYWKCEIGVSNYYVTLQNSSVVSLHPLENLTIYSPADNELSNESLNVSFSVIDYDENISCTLEVGGEGTTTINATSGETTYINYTLPTDGYYNWNLTCTAQGDTLYSDSYVYRYDSAPPVINELYVTPAYPHTYDDLNCSFNVTEDFTFNVNVTWYNDDVNVPTYDYTYSDVTSDALYTTAVGNGSVPSSVLTNYSNWTCQITVADHYIDNQNSSTVFLHPLENLTIYSPECDVLTNETMSVTGNVIDFDEGIICNLNTQEGVVGTTSPTSGVNFTIIPNSTTSFSYTLSNLEVDDGVTGDIKLMVDGSYDLEVCLQNSSGVDVAGSCRTYTSGEYGPNTQTVTSSNLAAGYAPTASGMTAFDGTQFGWATDTSVSTSGIVNSNGLSGSGQFSYVYIYQNFTRSGYDNINISSYYRLYASDFGCNAVYTLYCQDGDASWNILKTHTKAGVGGDYEEYHQALPQGCLDYSNDTINIRTYLRVADQSATTTCDGSDSMLSGLRLNTITYYSDNLTDVLETLPVETSLLSNGGDYRFKLTWNRMKYLYMNDTVLNNKYDYGGSSAGSVFDNCHSQTSSSVSYCSETTTDKMAVTFDSSCKGGGGNFLGEQPKWTSVDCTGGLINPGGQTTYYTSQTSCRIYEGYVRSGGSDFTGTCLAEGSRKRAGEGCVCSPTSGQYYLTSCSDGTPDSCPTAVATYAADTDYTAYVTYTTGSGTQGTNSTDKLITSGDFEWSQNLNYPSQDGVYYWNVSCTATGDPTPLYSQTCTYTYDTQPPTINELYIAPTYPNTFEDLNCTFNVTDAVPTNVTVSWFKSTDNTTWVANNTYDYTYEAITNDQLYSTTVGTGSVPSVDLTNYTYWKCQLYATDHYGDYQNSSQVDIHPLENLTIYTPLNNTYTDLFNATFSVIDYDGGIVCELNLNNSDSTLSNVTSGETTALNLSIATDGHYEWFVNCTSNGGTVVESLTYNLVYDSTTPGIEYGGLTESDNAYVDRNWVYVDVNIIEVNFANMTYRLYNSSDDIVNSTIYYTSTSNINWTGLPDEHYWYNVSMYDLAGHYNKTGTRNITLDTTDPIIEFAGGTPPNNTITNNASVLVNLTIVEENIDEMEWWLYNWSNGIYEMFGLWTVEETSHVWPIGLVDDSDGLYSYHVNITDKVGRTDTTGTRWVTIDTIPPLLYNPVSPDSWMYPEIGDTFLMNISVSDLHNVSHCILMLNDTGTWENKTTYDVGGDVNDTVVEMSYVITNVSQAAMSHISWAVWCNDTVGNNNVSVETNFTVKDVTLPLIQLGSNNGFDENNMTVVSSYLYNLTINITSFDYNLFQMMVNITCEKSGEIYYWEILDINTTSWSHYDVVNLSGLPAQKCDILTSSSDDHTEKKIKEYKEKKLSKGVEYETTEDINVEITTDDGKFKSLDSEKKIDRYEFKFKFKDEQTSRTFNIKANKKMYYQADSDYPAHLVIWNDQTHTGNWLDLDSKYKLDYGLVYDVVRISDYEYQVTVTSDIPLDELEFSSIGGTNVENMTWEFYIGGTINVSSLNVYDNGTFSDFNVTVTTIDSYPGNNYTANIPGESGFLTNLSNGTYQLQFSKSNYFNQTYTILVEESLENQTYATQQSILNVRVRNIKTGTYLTDLNITLTNVNTSQVDFANNNYSTTTTFNINASNYIVTIEKEDYETLNATVTLDYEQNYTLTIDIAFLAHFILIDENTLEPFNISGPDTIRFVLYCTDRTETTIINATEQDVPIDCDFEKFKFVIEYGTTSYYRTLLLDADTVLNLSFSGFNISVYLIDLLTTQSIYNSIALDDLLQEYDNPSIYVKKLVDDALVLITSDLTDIEGKIGAYLIINHEYLIEVHSDNQADAVLGTYSADIAGDKVIRLYTVGIAPTPSGFASSVSLTQAYDNNTDELVLVYEDTADGTEQVTWNVYEGSESGALIDTVVTDSNDFQSTINVSGYQNVASIVIVEHSEGTYTYGADFKGNETINLPVLGHVSGGFMNWFLTMILGLLAIMSTIRSANVISLVMIGLAALFVSFGWFGMSWGVLALAAIISLLSLMKEGPGK